MTPPKGRGTETVPLSDLVEDLAVYPRSRVSSTNVANIVNAMESGEQLPPIIADRVTLKIIDGFHRRRALLRLLGKDASTIVEFRDYDTDATMLAAAAALNTCHGLPLGEYEKREVVLRLGELGEDDDVIALALRVPPTKIEQIRIQVATVVTETREPLRLQPLKRSTAWMQGGAMTESQARAHKSAPGTSWGLLAHQLTEGLREGLVEPDGRIITALQALQQQISVYLDAVTVSE